MMIDVMPIALFITCLAFSVSIIFSYLKEIQNYKIASLIIILLSSFALTIFALIVLIIIFGYFARFYNRNRLIAKRYIQNMEISILDIKPSKYTWSTVYNCHLITN